MQTYFDSLALGRSDLRQVASNAEVFHGYRTGTLQRPLPTPAMAFGSWLDAYLCGGKGPDPIPDDVHVIPFDSRRTKAAKDYVVDYQTDNPGVECITETEAEKLQAESDSQLESLEACVAQIESCPKAAALIYGKGTQHQHPLYWTDEDLGIDLKSLPDVVKTGAAIVDLKTSADTEESHVLRQIDRFWYDAQAYMMKRGWERCTGETLPVVFVVVRSVKPHDVEIYAAPDWMLETGRQKMEYGIHRYKQCEESGVWRSATHNNIVEPSKPKWWWFNSLERAE